MGSIRSTKLFPKRKSGHACRFFKKAVMGGIRVSPWPEVGPGSPTDNDPGQPEGVTFYERRFWAARERKRPKAPPGPPPLERPCSEASRDLSVPLRPCTSSSSLRTNRVAEPAAPEASAFPLGFSDDDDDRGILRCMCVPLGACEGRERERGGGGKG